MLGRGRLRARKPRVAKALNVGRTTKTSVAGGKSGGGGCWEERLACLDHEVRVNGRHCTSNASVQVLQGDP